ncbi:MAG: phospho-N-acetylmuramoyl-pentapeptide-transferase [Lachnospiraceae bacterium]|nr:phospho-N-acetylmuramoyl-pentapeptide-transferase [Lachnospiraceae bacterium]
MDLDYTIRLLVPLLAAWALALCIGRPLVPFLHRIRFDQTEREEGLESHKKKTGTPTMGGFIFLIPMVIVTALSVFLERASSDLHDAKHAAALIAVLIPTIGFALIGFADDYLKVVRHHNLGLRAWQKLVLQFAVTVIFALHVHLFTDISLSEMMLPFASQRVWQLGILGIPALILIALATSNGTNLTDGVDGLCASVTVPVALFFTLAAILMRGPGAPAGAAMAGALLGYLFYNFYPAKVFMGDTGSLAIGGFVIGMSYVLRMPLFIPIVGLIYAIEVISVALQVGYFKLTHGKRLFRMAPIHHHFEKGGWSETRVVGVFTTVTILMCLIALAGIAPAFP